MSLAGTIKLSVALTSTVVRDLSTSVDPLVFAVSKTIANGTGANQATKMFSDKISFSGTTPQNLNVYSPDTATPTGETYLLTRIVALIISNRHATATLTVGGEGSGAEWTQLPDAIVIPGGGCLFLYAGSAAAMVAASGNNLLKMLPSASLDADVVLVGS